MCVTDVDGGSIPTTAATGELGRAKVKKNVNSDAEIRVGRARRMWRTSRDQIPRRKSLNTSACTVLSMLTTSMTTQEWYVAHVIKLADDGLALGRYDRRRPMGHLGHSSVSEKSKSEDKGGDNDKNRDAAPQQACKAPARRDNRASRRQTAEQRSRRRSHHSSVPSKAERRVATDRHSRHSCRR